MTTTSLGGTPFRVNTDEARRYGNYVRLGTFDPGTDDPPGVTAELAVYAWQCGTGPVMAPPYILSHPRVRAARLWRSAYDGVTLCATVSLAVEQPGFLRGLEGPGGLSWRDWPRATYSAGFRAPDDDETALMPFLTTTAILRFAVGVGQLPEPGDGADYETCRAAVAAVISELNAAVGPVLTRIEGS